MYPQIDKPFRCIDIYNRKAYIALWVHPFTLTQSTQSGLVSTVSLPEGGFRRDLFLLTPVTRVTLTCDI